MTVYTVALSKGGSTKTTTAAELAVALGRRGRKVLAVDLDQQGNLSTRLGLDETTEVTGVAADVLLGDCEPVEAATPSPVACNVWVLAGTHDLAEMDQRPEVITALRDALPDAAFDDVVIDTPPALGVVTLAGLAAADRIVAAVACEAESYDQLARLREVIRQRVAPRLRKGAEVAWIVPTRYDPRRLLDKDVLAELHQHWLGHVTTPVREAVAAKDAYTAGMPVSIYAPTAGITNDYTTALTQLIEAGN